MEPTTSLPFEFEKEKFHHAMWIHGVNGVLDWEPALPDIGHEQIQGMIDSASLMRFGTGIRIEMTGSLSGNFVVHFPIPTQNIVAGHIRLHLQSIMLDFNASAAVIGKVKVRDGNRAIASFTSLDLSGDHPLEVIEVIERPSIFKGVNVSLTLDGALGGKGIVVFRAVGINMFQKIGMLPPTLESQ